MRNKDDIDAYLAKSPYTYQELEENTWLVRDASLVGSPARGATEHSASRENVVIRLSGGIVLFRVHVLNLEEVPSPKRGDFFSTLLELNATDMVHGAYGIQRGDTGPGKLMLTASMRLENLDYNEFVGIVDDFTVALAKHHEFIASFAKH